MEKYFTPPTQALELNELGFDEPCLASWNFYTNELNYNQRPSKFSSVDVVQLPTYSQAFGWFREKYGLAGLVEIGTQEYSFIIFDEVADTRKTTSSMNGKYEEAELACLINLIEIAKNQTHE